MVTLEDEFPNHYYYPTFLASRGVEFVETPFDRFYDAITPRTRAGGNQHAELLDGISPAARGDRRVL